MPTSMVVTILVLIRIISFDHILLCLASFTFIVGYLQYIGSRFRLRQEVYRSYNTFYAQWLILCRVFGKKLVEFLVQKPAIS